MTNSSQYRSVMELHVLANKCGFRVEVDFDSMSLMPKENLLPAYARDATLVRGDVEELLYFLYGWLKFKEYIVALGAIKPETIAKKEKDIRNRELLKIIKGNENDTVPF